MNILKGVMARKASMGDKKGIGESNILLDRIKKDEQAERDEKKADFLRAEHFYSKFVRSVEVNM